MGAPGSQAPPGSARAARRSGADLPVARIVALLLLVVPLGVFLLVANALNADSSQPAPAPATNSPSFDPRSVFSDSTPHFLPTPIAALPAETNAGPPAPAASEQDSAAAATERVKIANTGGAGAILRADPPKGRQLAALRDGTLLQVLEHRQVDDGSEWLHVRTPDGAEGWVFSRLVASAN